MSDAPDPLEAELAALTPPAASPELRQRIAGRLAGPAPVGHRRAWWLALAGGLVVAGVTAVLVWPAGRPTVGPGPEPVVIPQPAPPAVEVESPGPTLLVYRRALAGTPDDLDALLDEDATLAPDPGPERTRIGAFTRSEAQLHSLIGDN